MAHAFFAPSSAPRVVECPASLLLTAGMPDKAGVDAAHGTAAHWVADLALRNKCHVEKYAGCTVHVSEKGECQFMHDGNRGELALEMAFGKGLSFEVDDEMVNAVQEYVDWCNDAPGEKYPECRVDISKWCPKDSPNIFVPAAAFEPQGGTSDHAACSPGVLIITDLKYGKGLKIFAEKNYQAVLYALGFIDEWDWLYEFKEIHIRICQPRLDHKDVWVITREEIEEIGRYILARFTLALQEDAPFGPSEKACKFCKASGLCRAQAEYLSAQRALAFEDLDDDGNPTFVDTRLLTPEELVQAFRSHGLFKARYDALIRHMEEMLQEGKTLPGLKLVEARTHRRWIDAKLAADEIAFATDLPREKMFTEPTMLSPNQVEKLLPKKQREIVKTLAEKPRGGPCIVEEGDSRPDYDSATAARLEGVFDDLDDPFA